MRGSSSAAISSAVPSVEPASWTRISSGDGSWARALDSASPRYAAPLKDGMTTETVRTRRNARSCARYGPGAMGRSQRLHETAVRALRRAGWNVHRHPGWFDFAHRRSVLMGALGIDLVFDVGANTGQFARELRDYGYRGRIVSFEPLSAAYATLAAQAAADEAWTALHTAIGDRDGTVAIHVAANGDSSSALPMGQRHLDAAPQSAYVADEEAPLARLDGLVAPYLGADRRAYLKVDTQGYEWAVLDGALETLPRLTAVELELSLVELYEGQHTWLELIERMRDAGMRPVGLGHDFWDERTGETLQVDGIFARDETRTGQ
jgi:FkbM family methyltransferase